MRNIFAEQVTLHSYKNKKIVLLAGDIGNHLFDEFKIDHSSHFFNCGVAESNMMGVAAGLALSGFRPIVYTIAPFTTTRCYEQIRVDVCYHSVPVIIVGTGAGLSYAELGPTHHSLEDIAIMRVLPGMTVFCPADAIELTCGLEAALSLEGPIYIRLGKKGEPILHQSKPNFSFGKALTLRKGTDVCLISTGTITSVALEAANKLQEIGISAQVESFHTIKPLDVVRLKEIFTHYTLVATIEEHNHIGGLFGSVSEWYATQRNLLGRIIPFSTKDEFIHEVGSQNYARKKYGLTSENICTVIQETLSKTMNESVSRRDEVPCI